jgi:cysteine desulfurase
VGVMRDRFERAILEAVSDASVNGVGASRLPNTSSFLFDGIESDAALMLLDQHHICCSAGSACRTGSQEASHVLRAMKLVDERVRASLRFSFGRFNSDSDVVRASEIVPSVIDKLRRLSAATPADAQPALGSLS